MQADAEINIAEEASMKTKPVGLEPVDNGSDTESPTLNKVKRKRNASDQIMEATHKRSKKASGSGDNAPVRPRNMKGGKKQGEPENAGSTGSDASTGVFSADAKPPVDYLEKLKMVICVITMAREWEKRLSQLMESLPDVDVVWDMIKKIENFSSENAPQTQTGLESPELQPLPKGGEMKRGRPGQRFGKRGEKQIIGKLYWQKRAMKLLIQAKKLVSGRRRRSVPSSLAREPPTPQGVEGPAAVAAQEVFPEPEPSLEELEPEIEESDEEIPEPPTPKRPAAAAGAEEVSTEPEPSSEEEEPEIEESDEEIPEPPTPKRPVAAAADAEEVSSAPKPSLEELEPEIEEIDEEPVYAEVMKRWEWEQKKFGARHIGQEFRLVNLQNITSFAQVVTALHGAIQQVLGNVSPSFGAGDFVRMRFEGGDRADPLFSVKLKGELDADEFLSQLGSLLESDMELSAELTFRLIVTIVKRPPRGIPSRCLVSTD